jgi:hypothetical protein
MRDFWKFLASHPIPGTGAVLGPCMSVGALVMEAHDVMALGLRAGDWAAIGAAIFFSSVVGILYNWWRRDNSNSSTLRNSVPKVLVSASHKSDDYPVSKAVQHI